RLAGAFDCRAAGERYLSGPGGQPLRVHEVVARQGSQSASSADATSEQVAPAVLEAPGPAPRPGAFTAKGPT
ncbi:protein kinase, partial [Corallococcus sp. 4LFB]